MTRLANFFKLTGIGVANFSDIFHITYGICRLCQVIYAIAEISNAYAGELEKVSLSIANLNQVYEKELSVSRAQAETMQKLHENMNSMLENLHGSVEDSQKYRTEIAHLSQKVSTLNEMYSKMLLAMGAQKS